MDIRGHISLNAVNTWRTEFTLNHFSLSSYSAEYIINTMGINVYLFLTMTPNTHIMSKHCYIHFNLCAFAIMPEDLDMERQIDFPKST